MADGETIFTFCFIEKRYYTENGPLIVGVSEELYLGIKIKDNKTTYLVQKELHTSKNESSPIVINMYPLGKIKTNKNVN